jgi:hypothetical protein
MLDFSFPMLDCNSSHRHFVCSKAFVLILELLKIIEIFNCRHFKEQVGQQQASKKEEMRWKMIVSKVRLAKTATSTFSLAAVSAELDQGT